MLTLLRFLKAANLGEDPVDPLNNRPPIPSLAQDVGDLAGGQTPGSMSLHGCIGLFPQAELEDVYEPVVNTEAVQFPEGYVCKPIRM